MKFENYYIESAQFENNSYYENEDENVGYFSTFPDNLIGCIRSIRFGFHKIFFWNLYKSKTLLLVRI